MNTIVEALRAATAGSKSDEIWAAHRGTALRGRRGQAIFHAEDPSDAVYFLIDGEVRAYIGDAPANRTTLLLRGPAIFGDRDLLTDESARETYELLSPGRILLWDAATFLAAYRRDQALENLILEDLVARYARTLALSELFVAPLPDRLAAVLHDRLGAGLTDMPDPAYLASITNTVEKSVTRALTALRKAGILSGGESGAFVVSPTASPPTLARAAPIFHSLARSSLR